MRLNGPVAEIRRVRTVAAEPQAVWDVLADFGAISAWADNVDHSCLLEHGADGLQVGTSRRVQVRRDTLVERITEVDPPTTLGYGIEGLPRRLRVGNRWSLAPVATGHTEVAVTTTVDLGTNPLATLVERALCRFLAKQSDVMLGGLAKRTEGRSV